MKKSETLKINKYLLLLLLLTFCIPNVNLISAFSYNVKIYRVLTFSLFLFVIFNKNANIVPSKKIFFFLLYMLFISVVCIPFNGYDRLLFDYIFAYIIIVVVYNFGKNIKYDEWIKIFQIAAFFAISLVFLNLFKQKEIIIDFIKNPLNQHPNYKSLYPGGLNLESTWIAFFSLFFVNKPYKGYIYLFFSMLVSVVLSSRVGLIINLFSLFFILYNHVKNRGEKINVKKVSCFIFIFFSIILLFTVLTNLSNNIISRFANIGSDGGSQGRLNIWKNIIPSYINYPFGCGLGNAMKIIKSSSGMWFGEDNVHNLYCQILLDTGIIGLIIFVLFIVIFYKKNKRIILINPFVMYIIIYFIIAFVQFKGAEILAYYIIAIYLILSKQGDIYDEKNFCLNDSIQRKRK